MGCGGGGGGDIIRQVLPAEFQNNARDWTQYGLFWDPLAASANAQAESVQIDNNSDFLVVSIDAVVVEEDVPATEIVFWPFTMRIRDSATGQNWNISQTGTTHISTIVGRMSDDGQGPHWLEYPRWVERGAAVRVELTNLDSTAYQVWLGLNGIRIYDFPLTDQVRPPTRTR